MSKSVQELKTQENIVIISGTNRPDSNTHKVSMQYRQVLEALGIDAPVLSLVGLEVGNRSAQYDKIEAELLIPASKFIFIVPEYNGSIPGVLKAMIDISDYKKCWWGKKALLVGVSTGRAGNLLGMGHLTAILHNLRMIVHPNQVPISSIERLLNGTHNINDESTVKTISNQLEDFIRF